MDNNNLANSDGEVIVAEASAVVGRVQNQTRRLMCGRISVSLLTYLVYMVLHSARKSLSTVKSTVSDIWTESNISDSHYHPDLWNRSAMFESHVNAEFFLGSLDAAFMFMYAVCLFIGGYLGDKYNPRLILVSGLAVSGVSILCFGYVSELRRFYRTWYYMLMWLVNAAGQATAWPILIAVMSNWFPKDSRGLVMGLWSSCASSGNILAALIAGDVLQTGYENVFLVNGVMILIVMVLVLICLIPSPEDIDIQCYQNGPQTTLPVAEENVDWSEDDAVLIREMEAREHQEKSSIGFLSALKLPGVITCSLSFACVKMVVYSFFFWLPYYLHSKYGWDEAVDDRLSVWFDVGAIFGGIISGWISDKLGYRIILVELSMICSIPLMFIYDRLEKNLLNNAIVMAFLGYFLGGAGSIIGTAITADLVKTATTSNRGLSTVAGIVDGSGSLGAAVGQLLLPVVQSQLGWSAVFTMFILTTVLAVLCLMPSWIRQSKCLYDDIRSSIIIRREQRGADDLEQ